MLSNAVPTVGPVAYYAARAGLNNSWTPWTTDDTDFTSQIISDLEREGLSFEGLSDTQLENLLRDYWESSDWGLGTTHTFDRDRFVSDYTNFIEGRDTMPDPVRYDELWEQAQARADSEAAIALRELETLGQRQTESFNDELKKLSSGYADARSALLSNQYQQNAQLMDTLSYQMDKSNRNALEAGASAGIRLAGNVNTLLSTQNKQSQTSLETANQLAQMLVSQRNAEASVRGRYWDTMGRNLATKRGIQNSALGKAQEYYNQNADVSEKAYDAAKSDWDNAYYSNPIWENKALTNKSKYNPGG
jgi:hypothetical protein